MQFSQTKKYAGNLPELRDSETSFRCIHFEHLLSVSTEVWLVNKINVFLALTPGGEERNVTMQCKIECVEWGHLSKRFYGGGLLQGISLWEGGPEMSLKKWVELSHVKINKKAFQNSKRQTKDKPRKSLD